MNYEINMIRNNNLAQYYQACEDGNLDKIKILMTTLDMGVSYYDNRHAIITASKNNQLSVLEFFIELFEIEYENKKNDPEKSSQLLYDSKIRSFKEYFHGKMVDFFRDSMQEICTKGYLEVLKFYVNFIGNIPSINDFEKCARWCCEYGHLEMTKYLLNTPKAQYYINEKKHYNSILPTTNTQANETIKYFLDQPQYSEKIKLLKLLERAYEDDNSEIIEYIIFDKNMLYSKKVKQAVESWTAPNRKYDIPQLFKDREKYLLCKKVENEIPQKTESIITKKLKI